MNRAEYQRRWRAANPEKVKAYAQAWRERNVEKVQAGKRKYREANRALLAAKERARRADMENHIAPDSRVGTTKSSPEDFAAVCDCSVNSPTDQLPQPRRVPHE